MSRMKTCRSEEPKYKAKKIKTLDGEFDSKKELTRWKELQYFQRAGLISDLRRQVKFELIPSQRESGRVVERPVRYFADFVYVQDGKTIVEDVKGYRKGTAHDVFVIKRKLMLWVHGIRVIEV